MPSILFICTGNIFRSVVAEYALKAALGHDSAYRIGSAGVEAHPQEIHPLIRLRVLEKGIDLSRHIQRKLTRELLDATDLPVAMGLNHQEFIRAQFGREVFLFNQICFDRHASVLDIHEVIPDWQANQSAAREYAASVIDYICDAMPTFLQQIQQGRPASTPRINDDR